MLSVSWGCIQDFTYHLSALRGRRPYRSSTSQYFPYRATFDFECMFSPNTGLNNTEKLTWETKHIPLSLSVCSNLPGYDQPKCFVSEGDSKQLVKQMVDYLVEISQESYRRMKIEFSFLFDAINEKLEKNARNRQKGMIALKKKIVMTREKISWKR